MSNSETDFSIIADLQVGEDCIPKNEYLQVPLLSTLHMFHNIFKALFFYQIKWRSILLEYHCTKADPRKIGTSRLQSTIHVEVSGLHASMVSRISLNVGGTACQHSPTFQLMLAVDHQQNTHSPVAYLQVFYPLRTSQPMYSGISA
jgi:hypothetical protein